MRRLASRVTAAAGQGWRRTACGCTRDQRGEHGEDDGDGSGGEEPGPIALGERRGLCATGGDGGDGGERGEADRAADLLGGVQDAGGQSLVGGGSDA
jgi:hypothetical protein